MSGVFLKKEHVSGFKWIFQVFEGIFRVSGGYFKFLRGYFGCPGLVQRVAVRKTYTETNKRDLFFFVGTKKCVCSIPATRTRTVFRTVASNTSSCLHARWTYWNGDEGTKRMRMCHTRASPLGRLRRSNQGGVRRHRNSHQQGGRPHRTADTDRIVHGSVNGRRIHRRR